MLLNSKVKHELKGSPYNDRRNSCENVVKALNAKFADRHFDTLRDANWDDLEAVNLMGFGSRKQAIVHGFLLIR